MFQKSVNQVFFFLALIDQNVCVEMLLSAHKKLSIWVGRSIIWDLGVPRKEKSHLQSIWNVILLHYFMNDILY